MSENDTLATCRTQLALSEIQLKKDAETLARTIADFRTVLDDDAAASAAGGTLPSWAVADKMAAYFGARDAYIATMGCVQGLFFVKHVEEDS